MRFAAMPRQKQLPKRSVTAALMRKLTGEGQSGKAAGKPAVTTQPQDAPADLDQRVRLVGEW